MEVSGEVEALIDQFKAGSRVALAKLITRLDDSRDTDLILSAIEESPNRSRVIGITGAPGAGKSTLTGCLISEIVGRDQKVAVLAVDPSSPFSGGALLGDRIRMTGAMSHENVFMRSLSSRGASGGLSDSTSRVIRLAEAFGFDYVLVETVGAGQAETAVMDVTQLVILLLFPGAGDDIQWEKAGLMEIADIVVINKADREGAEALETQLLRSFAEYGRTETTPIVKTVATRGKGIDDLLREVDSALSKPREARRVYGRIAAKIIDEAQRMVADRLYEMAELDDEVEKLKQELVSGRMDLARSARVLLDRLAPGLGGVKAGE